MLPVKRERGSRRAYACMRARRYEWFAARLQTPVAGSAVRAWYAEAIVTLRGFPPSRVQRRKRQNLEYTLQVVGRRCVCPLKRAQG